MGAFGGVVISVRIRWLDGEAGWGPIEARHGTTRLDTTRHDTTAQRTGRESSRESGRAEEGDPRIEMNAGDRQKSSGGVPSCVVVSK